MKPEIKYLDDQVRGMITDFMNDGATRGQEVYLNNKGGNRQDLRHVARSDETFDEFPYPPNYLPPIKS